MVTELHPADWNHPADETHYTAPIPPYPGGTVPGCLEQIATFVALLADVDPTVVRKATDDLRVCFLWLGTYGKHEDIQTALDSTVSYADARAELLAFVTRLSTKGALRGPTVAFV